MDKNEIQIIETYCFISNLDGSIILLNDWLKEKGFEFIEIDLLDFQNLFGQLVYYKPNPKQAQFVKTGNVVVDADFYKLFQNTPFCESKKNNQNLTVILLKMTKEYELQIINNIVQINISHSSLIMDFADVLLRKLRLYKSGNISKVYEFEIEKKSRHVIYKATSKSNGYRWSSDIDIYTLAEEEMPHLIDFLNVNFKVSKLNEIAILNLESTYAMNNLKVRFITLVTSLESLFNFGKEQIAHTISRHLSLIISDNRESFDANYKRIKKIYSKRNNIVHGSSENVSKTEIYELENLVRESILFTFKNEFNSKEDFFHFLNSKGFN